MTECSIRIEQPLYYGFFFLHTLPLTTKVKLKLFYQFYAKIVGQEMLGLARSCDVTATGVTETVVKF